MSQDLQRLTYNVEMCLLGSLLHSQLNANARAVLGWYKAEMFATFKLGTIFAAIQKQALKDNVIDLMMLETDYGQSISDLAEAMKTAAGAANLLGYADKAFKLYQRREAKKVFLEVATELNHSRDEHIDSITTKGLNELGKLMKRNGKVVPLAMDNLLDGYMELFEERNKPSFKEKLLFTGNTALDEVLAGIGDTDICIVAGRAGNGKTETTITFTKNIIEKGGSVLFFSLEMSKEQIMDRLIASASGVNSVKLRNPEWMNDDDFARMGQALQAMQNQPLYIVDKSGLTMEEIIAIAQEHIEQNGKLKAIVIDYIGLVRHGALDGKINRTYQIGESMERLKTFTKDNHTPVILLAQLNRNAEGSRPTNNDLRESGSLEQDASQIIMVHNQRDKETSEPHRYTEWIVTKNRFGKLGTVYVEFQNGRFIECDQALAWEASQKPAPQKQSPKKNYGA